MTKRKVGVKKSPEQRSQVISARLNPDYDEDRKALEQWGRMKADGYEPRAILTHALIQMAGITPEMFHRTQQAEDVLEKLSNRLDTIDDIHKGVDQIIVLIENSIIDMLRNIKKEDPQGFREFANHVEEENGELDMGQRFIQNAQKAARKTFRQRGNE